MTQKVGLSDSTCVKEIIDKYKENIEDVIFEAIVLIMFQNGIKI